MPEPTKNEIMYRELWRLYEFLRDCDIEESKTAELLKRPDFDLFARKLTEELNEAEDAIKGQHPHPFVRECSEAVYWLFLAGISRYMKYHEIYPAPHEAIMHGFEEGIYARPDIRIATEEDTRITTINAMRYLGCLCRDSDTRPEAVAKYDLRQMSEKPYLCALLSPEATRILDLDPKCVQR